MKFDRLIPSLLQPFPSDFKVDTLKTQIIKSSTRVVVSVVKVAQEYDFYLILILLSLHQNHYHNHHHFIYSQ